MNERIHDRLLDTLTALNPSQTAGPYNVLRVIACLPVDAKLSRATKSAMKEHINKCKKSKADGSNTDLIARHQHALSIIKDGHSISSVNVDYLGKLMKNLTPSDWIAAYRTREKGLKLIPDKRNQGPASEEASKSDSEGTTSEDNESDEYHVPTSAGPSAHARGTRSPTVRQGRLPSASGRKRRADNAELDEYVLAHHSSFVI